MCKLDLHKKAVRRGYIAMLAVDEKYRRFGIGKSFDALIKVLYGYLLRYCNLFRLKISDKSDSGHGG